MGRSAITRGVPVWAGLRPAGSGCMTCPPLLCTSRAVYGPEPPYTLGSEPARASPGGVGRQPGPGLPGGCTPFPQLFSTSQAAFWQKRPLTWGSGPDLASPGRERPHALPPRCSAPAAQDLGRSAHTRWGSGNGGTSPGAEQLSALPSAAPHQPGGMGCSPHTHGDPARPGLRPTGSG